MEKRTKTTRGLCYRRCAPFQKIYVKKLERRTRRCLCIQRTQRRYVHVLRYENILAILRDYTMLNKLPETIHVDLIKSEVLIFEDSFYNFNADMWVDIFDKTLRPSADGQPDNPLYRIVTDERKATTTLVFNSVYCNGYVHDTDDWKTLLVSPVIRSGTSSTVLVVEITARVGPAAVFKVYRCKHPECVARSLDLAPRESYVKVLDVRSCVNLKSGRVQRPLKYISMREDEYLDTFNYV